MASFHVWDNDSTVSPRIWACALLAIACSRAEPSSPLIPWAWERREDLRFADTTEVAYLAASLDVRGATVSVYPRMQPLQVSSAARVIPVIRIEARTLPYTAAIEAVIAAILRIEHRVKPERVQLDFDATESQRLWYAALLRTLRSRLDPTTKISITALASWCMEDRWLEGLPVDEAVPMLFRMGSDRARVRGALARGDDFAEPRCRSSLGIATDEPLPRAPRGRRTYVFHNSSWNENAWRSALSEVRAWP
jgi:hypothetical protein